VGREICLTVRRILSSGLLVTTDMQRWIINLSQGNNYDDVVQTDRFIKVSYIESFFKPLMKFLVLYYQGGIFQNIQKLML
jgi:hypothetical protein